MPGSSVGSIGSVIIRPVAVGPMMTHGAPSPWLRRARGTPQEPRMLTPWAASLASFRSSKWSPSTSIVGKASSRNWLAALSGSWAYLRQGDSIKPKVGGQGPLIVKDKDPMVAADSG